LGSGLGKGLRRHRAVSPCPRALDMPHYFGYLRVSTDGQDVDSQKLGLLEYANSHGFSPVDLVAETVSRSANWKGRELGALLARAGRGMSFSPLSLRGWRRHPARSLPFSNRPQAKGYPTTATPPAALTANSQRQTQARIAELLESNRQLFNEEREKLEKWADDKLLLWKSKPRSRMNYANWNVSNGGSGKTFFPPKTK